MAKSIDISGYESEMVKPNELIAIRGSGPLTLHDRRTFNILLNNAWGKSIINAGEEFAIDTASLKDAAQTNQRLKRSLRRLMTTVVVSEKSNGDEVETQLLGSTRLTRAGVLTYSFPNELAEVLKDSSIFAKLDLEVMKSFGSKYAFALYEGIARRINLKHKFSDELDVDDVRDLLGVDGGKLTAYRNLRLKAIEPAVAEVNAITPYGVAITPINKGRKVTGFKMHWWLKDKEGLMKSYQELQSSRVGRKQRQGSDTDDIVE